MCVLEGGLCFKLFEFFLCLLWKFFFITANYFCKAQKSCWNLKFFDTLHLSCWRLFSLFLGLGSLSSTHWKPHIPSKLLQKLYLTFSSKSESSLERFPWFFFSRAVGFGSNNLKIKTQCRKTTQFFSERNKIAQKKF